ncbi:ROK family transcriptional regulator [Catenuloplanes indicus]|uniref:NBD/HSP70 family sugar kinase n=1 Tax=Catenuloplanes indicus TaxID=137267 RepID=A0AAE3W264_9ACTN|nr:ROK family transcriptional regulator [Catenuloplanes indicus]MDQ0367105.1 putative NBD/HSP70 family sugar kinase [Catenuloplanes indicus]
MRAGPSQDEVRRQNLGALLRYVHVHGPISRAELTTRLGLNRSTIGALTADLTAAGLVREEAPRGSRRAGRPSLVVLPESSRVYAYALSIEVDRLRAARVGLGGEVLDERVYDRPRDLRVSEVVGPLAAFVKEMQHAAPEGGRYVGVGVAVAGMVRRHDGLVRLTPKAGWVDEPLAEPLAEALGGDHTVRVGNHADLALLAEHLRGVAVDTEDVIYLHGEVGIGAGIIAHGTLITGHGGYAGEVGHMIVHPGGRTCSSCGARGCWESEIGEEALLHALGTDGSGRIPAHQLIAAMRGDPGSHEALRQIGEWLGLGVANLVNIFNPEMVIFGGTLRNLYLTTAAQVRSRLNSLALPASRELLRLRTPKLGEDAALIGAAELAFTQLLADPLSEAPVVPRPPAGR